MADFRRKYYSTLGVQTVDAKSSLDLCFSVDPIDFVRLQGICRSVKIPRMYRPLVWKTLLGVAPHRKELWGFMDAQRKDEFEDVRGAAAVLFSGNVRDSMDTFTADDMVKMAMIHDSKGTFRARKSRHFTQCTHLGNLLKTHSPTLLAHLDSIRVDLSVFAQYWFSSFFSLVLPAHGLEGIWDAVISGAWEILDYLGLSLLLASRRKMEGFKSAPDLIMFLLEVRGGGV
ncbi:TBC1 domain member 7 [Podochytrium sp. JEL0797]|nr:TBC1 domain member 7 [Podochytrium sp. JEL0797]